MQPTRRFLVVRNCECWPAVVKGHVIEQITEAPRYCCIGQGRAQRGQGQYSRVEGVHVSFLPTGAPVQSHSSGISTFTVRTVVSATVATQIISSAEEDEDSECREKRGLLLALQCPPVILSRQEPGAKEDAICAQRPSPPIARA